MDLTLGSRIRDLRKAAGFSQRELANRIGADFTYLSKIENDHSEAPSEDILRRIAKETGGDADELIRLAGKLPADIVDFLVRNPSRVALLRRLVSKEKRG